MSDKLKYFIEAWEMNGVGQTVATVQDSPGTVVTITVDDLRALLARQPAAIDMQEAAVTREDVEQARDRILEQSKNSLFRSGVKICAGEILSPIEPCDKPPAGWTCSRTKGHEGPCAASLAAPLVEQDERELIELLRNVCHYADSVCGMLRQGGWPGKAEALESRIKAVIDFDANSRDKETNLPCPICNGVEGCDHTVPERARAASTSANVAQGAEAKLEFMPVDSMQHAIVYGSTEAIGALKTRMERDYRIASLVPAPPAQTALTDDARLIDLFDVLMRQNIETSDESYLSLKCVGVPPTKVEFVAAVQCALTAAQSASGETK
jgi:hypothetical protein